jgi:hypothetical protein
LFIAVLELGRILGMEVPNLGQMEGINSADWRQIYAWLSVWGGGLLSLLKCINVFVSAFSEDSHFNTKGYFTFLKGEVCDVCSTSNDYYHILERWEPLKTQENQPMHVVKSVRSALMRHHAFSNAPFPTKMSFLGWLHCFLFMGDLWAMVFL